MRAMTRTERDDRRVQPEHERLVEELAALPASERRAIVQQADEKGFVSSSGDAVEEYRRMIAEGSPVHQATLTRLEAALSALGEDLAPRVEELAEKSTAGSLTPEEHREYAEIVRLTDSLSLLRLQAKQLWSLRAAS